MKNKLSDVRNHLVSMLEELGDKEVSDAVIRRAGMTAQVAHAYIAAVKTEVDAIRVAVEVGYLPSSIDAPSTLPGSKIDEPETPQPRLVRGA